MEEETIRVLLVDDDEDDYVLTRDLLEEAMGARFEVDWEDGYRTGLEALSRAEHDCYLVDYRLGERDGLDLLAAAVEGGCPAPIIMLTGWGDHTVDATAMLAGAADYLDKAELSGALLGRSVRHAIERRKAEEALRASEERYRTLFENAEVGMYRSKLDGSELLAVNRKLAEIGGMTVEELQGAPSIVHWGDPADREEMVRQMSETGVVRNYETEVRAAGGEIKTVLMSAHTVPGQEWFEGSLIDITERKRAEQEVRTRALQQAVVAGLGQLALAATELSVLMDEAVARVSETLRVEYCKVLELLPDGSALLLRAGAGWREGLVGQANVGSGLDSQAGYTLASEEPVVVVELGTEKRFSGPSLLVDHGVVSGMSVIIRGPERPYGVMGAHTTRPRAFSEDDVHFLQAVANVLGEAIERRQAEDILRQRAHELAALNSLGSRVSASLSPQQVADAALEEVSGSVSPQLAMLFLREGDRLVLQGASPHGSSYRHEEIPVHKVGECLCGLAVIEKQPVYSKDIQDDPRCTWEECKEAGLRSVAALPLCSGDEVIGALALASGYRRDFSEQSAFLETLAGQVASGLQNALLHEQVRRHAAGLEARVQERTAELREAQERLIRQEKLAVLGQLAGGVGHELRNPLGAIKNAAYFLDMALADRYLEPEVAETLEILEREVNRSERIIGDLLGFARTRPPERHTVHLNDAVLAAVSRARVPSDPPIEVVLRLDDELPSIQADLGQLSQVIENIVRNGFQAMPGGGRLTVRTSRDDPQWVAVSVADTGQGIPEEDLEKVFEPLFTTKAKGIGLGLAIARTLVEGHGGEIRVESQVGHGSTFAVRLPVE
jgi:PAS domain S-box-containing protein